MTKNSKILLPVDKDLSKNGHLRILAQGVRLWNRWREKNPDIRPYLSHAKLHEVDLRGINFGEMFLYGVDLSEANLSDVDFDGSSLNLVDLEGAKLRNAQITAAEIVNSNLRRADLSGAELSNLSISRSDLAGANFTRARMGFTIFAELDLSEVIGLETTRHDFPSSVGIEVIYLSDRKIPREFLRRIGTPPKLISLLIGRKNKLKIHSGFISHSSKDKRFCERLHKDLRARNIRLWYFSEDAKWGEPVWGEIDRSIKIYDKLIVVCSKNSLTSGPVLREIERALNREDKERKSILFPITIDSYVFEEWEHPRKLDVLAKVVGDFRGWNRSAAKYGAAFKKLLKELKAE